MSILDEISTPARTVLGLIAKYAPENIAAYARAVEGVGAMLDDGHVSSEEMIAFAKECITLASDEMMRAELGDK
jgi:hypothetical protein